MISILCPSRGRPSQFTEMVHSAWATAEGDLEVIAYLDDDDPCYDGYAEQMVELPSFVTFITGPRVVLSQAWNECFAIARGEIVMHGSDDVRFRTPGWDRIVADAFKHFPDRIVLVHGDDGGDHEQEFATLGFLHRRWVETVGYFLPPYFTSDMNDTWLTEVADKLGRRVKVEILTEHMHPLWGKGELDLTHQERMRRHGEHRPDLLYEELAPNRARDVEKLAAAIELAATV